MPVASASARTLKTYAGWVLLHSSLRRRMTNRTANSPNPAPTPSSALLITCATQNSPTSKAAAGDDHVPPAAAPDGQQPRQYGQRDDVDRQARQHVDQHLVAAVQRTART